MKRGVTVVVVVGLIAALAWWLRSRDSGKTSAPPERVANAERGKTHAGFAGGPARPGGRPGLLGNSKAHLPPPPGELGKPIRSRPLNLGKLQRGEFPLRPPLFADAAERKQFRDWWKREYKRRLELYKGKHPRQTYPNDETADALLDKLYDYGEPPRPGEDAAAYDERSQKWFEAWRDATAAFGTPPKTILSFGADPQFGQPEAPPVLPPGMEPKTPDTTRPRMSADEVPDQTRNLGEAADPSAIRNRR